MKKTSRRVFLTSTGIAAAGIIVVPSIFAKMNSATPYAGKKLNVALAGLGRYAEILAEGLQQSQYCRLAGVVTGHQAKAELWQNKFNLAGKNIYNYENFDSVAGNKDIDLIYVVLPNSMHQEYTIRAAKAGKHVITEKPMATAVKDCEEMIKACS